jgi:LmbE family N-acetylglucosaminyl deacetylase
MTTTDMETPGRALAIAAHPDDIEFGAGATLAKWAAGGCEVSLLVCTDGSKGSWDLDTDTAELVATRRAEQRSAAAELGATGDVVFLSHVDGELGSGMAERAEVAECIRRLRPDVVLGHDPWKRYRLHPDHRNAGFLTIEGIVAARDPHFFPELGIPHHRPRCLLLFEAEEVDHVESVDGFENHKLAALEAHRSQFESTMFVSGSDDGTELARFRSRELDRMKAFGELAGMSLGEGFKRIDDL